MIDGKIFVPRILLCGDKEYFFSHVGQRPFEIVGQVEFLGESGHEFDLLREGKFLLDGNLLDLSELSKMIQGGVCSFIVFNDSKILQRIRKFLRQIDCPRSQVMTLREFNHLPLDGFYDVNLDRLLLEILKSFPIKTLLDADAHFVKGQLFTKSANDLTEIDCVCSEKILPIKENIFHHVYKNFSECALRRYDAALINEKSPADFDNALATLEHSADLVITFVQNGSPLAAHIKSFPCDIIRAEAYQSFAGSWFFCYRRPREDFAMYVVTHKKLPPEHVQRLPEGYKVIHAGRALGEDLGYLGNDSGDNISELNPFLNEITALYWMWKNTSHSIVGLSHYRRFFVADGKNFLTAEEAANILKSYDIIVTELFQNWADTSEILRRNICDNDITPFAESIIRKNLIRAHPDYLEAFNLKMNSPMLFRYNMFVAPRNIFDAYCEWLFSFMIDSTREILNRTPLAGLSFSERRLPAHFSERMMTVWLMKNRLRIKEMNFLKVEGL